MGTDFDKDHRGAPPESWAEPFRKALGLRGRPDSKLKWYLIWAKRFAAYLAGRPPHLATHDDAKGFLTTLASSPRVSGWQVEQATDALTILLGSVFGQDWAKWIRIPAPPPPPDVPLPKGDDPVERLRYAIRCRRYSARTEESYAFRVSRILSFCRVRGNMCCGVIGNLLMLRVGPKGYESTLSLPHARAMDFTGRPMKGMVCVEPAGFVSTGDLKAWIARAMEFTLSLPAK